MKQLSLVKLNLDVAELLPKEKLKTIFGGYGSGECVATVMPLMVLTDFVVMGA